MNYYELIIHFKLETVSANLAVFHNNYSELE